MRGPRRGATRAPPVRMGNAVSVPSVAQFGDGRLMPRAALQVLPATRKELADAAARGELEATLARAVGSARRSVSAGFNPQHRATAVAAAAAAAAPRVAQRRRTTVFGGQAREQELEQQEQQEQQEPQEPQELELALGHHEVLAPRPAS